MCRLKGHISRIIIDINISNAFHLTSGLIHLTVETKHVSTWVSMSWLYCGWLVSKGVGKGNNHYFECIDKLSQKYNYFRFTLP